MVQMVREGADRYAQGLLTYAQVNGGFKITGIDASFTGNFLPIPESLDGLPITAIGDWAFHACTSLASITIPASVTTIGDGAFYGCDGLASVAIPASVTSIGGGAFSDCTSLTSVTIPGSVTNIGNSAFRSCTSLTGVTIPDSITSIGDYAFCDCTALATVTIPNGVTSIGYGAFSGCTALTSITIPDSVTSIGAYAFDWCTSLTSSTIPSSVTSIESGTFSGCTSLTGVTIPDSVTNIGELAFCNCTSLASVTIPGGVTSIGDEAFVFCSTLTTVTIPASVTSIGSRVFCRCTALATVTIPDGVNSIGDFAFYGCTSPATVTIPASVRSIGKHAFGGCSSLASVIFNGDAPTISNNSDGVCVTFPKAFFTRAKIYFRPGTSGWGTKPKEKMIFKSLKEIKAYTDKHPNETFCWMMGEDYEIVPGEAAPATETAPEPAAKQDAALTEEKFTPPKKRLGEPNVRYKERVAAAEEGWKTSQAAKEPDTMPGATIAERVAAALEANPESAMRAREEANGNAEASSDEINAARVKETDIDTGEVRYRLAQDIEMGLVNPQTDVPVSEAERKIVAETWEREFGGKAHNSTHLADFFRFSSSARVSETATVRDDALTSSIRMRSISVSHSALRKRTGANSAEATRFGFSRSTRTISASALRYSSIASLASPSTYEDWACDIKSFASFIKTETFGGSSFLDLASTGMPVRPQTASATQKETRRIRTRIDNSFMALSISHPRKGLHAQKKRLIRVDPVTRGIRVLETIRVPNQLQRKARLPHAVKEVPPVQAHMVLLPVECQTLGIGVDLRRIFERPFQTRRVGRLQNRPPAGLEHAEQFR